MADDVKRVGALPGVTRGANRTTDWRDVCSQVDAAAPAWCLVGVFNPSVATHIRQGRYPAVDPALYEVATRKVQADGPKKASLYMKRREG